MAGRAPARRRIRRDRRAGRGGERVSASPGRHRRGAGGIPLGGRQYFRDRRLSDHLGRQRGDRHVRVLRGPHPRPAVLPGSVGPAADAAAAPGVAGGPVSALRHLGHLLQPVRPGRARCGSPLRRGGARELLAGRPSHGTGVRHLVRRTHLRRGHNGETVGRPRGLREACQPRCLAGGPGWCRPLRRAALASASSPSIVLHPPPSPSIPHDPGGWKGMEDDGRG